jgi:MFS family permease
MVEVYAFLAAFMVQILAMSVLYPTWFIRRVRMQTTRLSAEQFAQLYPGGDFGLAQERFLTQYRALNTGIAVLGVLLLGWLFSYMRRSNWNDDPVNVLVGVYFTAQMLPFGFIAWFRSRFNKVLKRSLPEGKHKAMLQRRGLFDFVSPFVVFLAVLIYFLFAAFVMYIRQHPFPGFGGYLNIGIITLGYVFFAFVVYRTLYGKKSNPLETHADRVHTIGLTVRICVYTCIVVVVFVSLTLALQLLDLQRWAPFTKSVFYVTTTLLCLMGLTAPPRRPEADGLGSIPVL